MCVGMVFLLCGLDTFIIIHVLLDQETERDRLA
jgi:hypothetical protein